jgi:hypothetical protein
MRDQETAVGVLAKLKADTAVMAAVIGGFQEPPLPEPRPQAPYGSLVVSNGQKNLISSGGREIDYRLVKVTIYGHDKAAVAAAGSLVNECLAEQPLTIENADWMRTEPAPSLEGGQIERADRTQDGVAWRARLEYVVWTSRPKS